MLHDTPDINVVRGLAKIAVEKAVSLGADQAEAFASMGATMGCGIEKDAVKGLNRSMAMGVGIRVLKDRRMGFSYATSEDLVSSAAEKALELCSLSPTTEMEFSGRYTPPNVEKTFDNRILKTSPEDVVDMAVAMLDSIASHGSLSALEGGVGCGVERFAVVSSNGLDVFSEGTDIGGGLYVMVKEGDPATGYNFDESRMMDIDLRIGAEKAAQMALDSRGPIKIDAGVMPVVFSPHAFSSLAEFILAPACYGDRISREESFFAGKIGMKVASEGLSLLDNGLLENGLNTSSIDDEGSPSCRTPIIDEGTLMEPIYDRGSALENGRSTTGNGVRCMQWSTSRTFKAPPSTRARNIKLEHSNPRGFEELLAEVGSGILVHDILGAHTSNPASGDFSVNSSIVFMIKNGCLDGPSKNVMLSGSIPQALQNIVGVGKEYENISGGLSPAAFRLPHIAIGGLRVA